MKILKTSLCLAALLAAASATAEEDVAGRVTHFVHTHGAYDAKLGKLSVPLRARHAALESLREKVAEGAISLVTTEDVGQRWQQVGSYPLSGEHANDIYGRYTGRVSALAVHPTDSSIVYLGGANGGIWKSIDGGDNWVNEVDHLDAQLRGSLAIGSIAIDAANGYVYAGTGEAVLYCNGYYGEGIWKYDPGEPGVRDPEWRVVGADLFAGQAVSDIVIHPTKPHVVWASTVYGLHGYVDGSCDISSVYPEKQYGVYMSTDFGETWTEDPIWDPALTSTKDGVTDLLYDRDVDEDDCVFAGSVDRRNRPEGGQRGVWRLCFGGTDQPGATPFLNDDAHLYDFPDTIGPVARIELADDPGDTEVVYAVASKLRSFLGLYRYEINDDVGTWTLLNHPPAAPEDVKCMHEDQNPEPGVVNVCEREGGQFMQCGYDLVIGVDDNRHIWLGGIGIWRASSLASPLVWDSMCHGNVHVDQQVLAFDGLRQELWLGNDGGVVQLPNVGNDSEDWVPKNTDSSLVLTQLYPGGSARRLPLGDELVLAGTQDVGFVRHESGLANSTQIEPVGWWTDGNATTIRAGTGGEDDWLLLKPQAKLHLTDDAGETWTTNTGIDAGAFLNRMVACGDPQQSERVTVLGRSFVHRSADYGVSFDAKGTQGGEHPLALEFTGGTSAVDPCDTYWVSSVSSASSSVFRFLGDDFTPGNDNEPCVDNPNCMELPESPDTPTEVVDFAGLPGYNYDSRRVVYASTGAAGTEGSHLWRSNNAVPSPGNPDEVPKFQAVDSFPVSELPILSILVDSGNPNRIFAGTDLGVFYTDGDDGEQSWAYMLDHPATPVYDLGEEDGAFYSFTHGRGVFRLERSAIVPPFLVRELYADGSQTELNAAALNMSGVLTVAGTVGGADAFVARFLDGEPLWATTVDGGSGVDVPNAVLTHGSGANEVTVAVGACEVQPGVTSGCVFKHDDDGDSTAAWFYGETGVEYVIEDATRVSYGTQTQRPGYVLVGRREAGGDSAAWIALVNAASGAIQWQKVLDGAGSVGLSGVAAVNSQKIAVVGTMEGELSGLVLATFLENGGALDDAAVFSDPNTSNQWTGHQVAVTPQGSFFVVGEEQRPGGSTGLLLQVDTDLELATAQVFSPGFSGRLESVANHNGDYVVAGTAAEVGSPDSGYWAVVTPQGALVSSRAYHAPWWTDPWTGTASFYDESDDTVVHVGTSRIEGLVGGRIVKTQPGGTLDGGCEVAFDLSQMTFVAATAGKVAYTFPSPTAGTAVQSTPSASFAPSDLTETTVCGSGGGGE